MADTKKLNKQQLDAVTHTDGPLLIIAGAGTGKTTVVTERVKWLITQGLARPEEILALTFTEKAAAEMEERIDIAMPYGYTQMRIMTFHGFCDRVLRDEGLAIGIDTSFKLLGEADSIALFKKHLFDFSLDYYRPLGSPNKFIGGLLQHFSRLGDEDISPGEYLSWSKPGIPYQELATAYKQWLELKIKNGVMEFADLIAYTLKLFRDRSNVLSGYQARFKYLLVDEYQDTNFAQNQLVNLLAGKKQNLAVVADDDQAIYRWRGAAISNVVQFRKTYPKARLVVLTQNYRSTQEILDKAYRLIQHNNPDRLEAAEKIDKKLTAARKIKGEPIEFIHVGTLADEAEAVAKKISDLLSADNLSLSPKDIAILVRANNHADPFAKALEQVGIPYQFLGPDQLFKQPEVKDLIAYLQILRDFTSDPAFYRVMIIPWWKISGREIAELIGRAKKSRLSLFEEAEKFQNQNVQRLVEVVHKHLEMSKTHSAGQVLYDFLRESGILEAILNYDPPMDEKKAKNVFRFFNRLKDFESAHEDASVVAVVDWLDLAIQIGESPLASTADWAGEDAVNILTVHSAKGLEFRIVFVVNLVYLRFPAVDKKEAIPIPDELIKEVLPQGDSHLQEERRLFYVAMTRARDRLFLTAADFYGDGRRIKKISPFVSEALGEPAIKQALLTPIQSSLLDWAPVEPNASTAPVLPNVDYLSYSQIQTFITCPLHYKARYILKIPTPATAAQSFGSSIHLALFHFYSNPKQNIIDLLHKHWIKDGYESADHEKLYVQKAEKLLREFLQVGYDPKTKTALLEQNFMSPLRFKGRYLKIGGKIDRVDVLDGGGIEIIDYKTGVKIPTQKEIDEDLQMSFYALAATSLRQPPFGQDPDNVKLSFYYFGAEGEKKMTTKRSAEQLRRAVEQIFAYADQIAASDFKCSGSRLCQHCEYQILCDIKTSE